MGSGGDQPVEEYPARLIRVRLAVASVPVHNGTAVVTGSRRTPLNPDSASGYRRYAALTVSGPAGANYNSIFCDAPQLDAIQQMDVWSPTWSRMAADRFDYLSSAVTFALLARFLQGGRGISVSP